VSRARHPRRGRWPLSPLPVPSSEPYRHRSSRLTRVDARRPRRHPRDVVMLRSPRGAPCDKAIATRARRILYVRRSPSRRDDLAGVIFDRSHGSAVSRAERVDQRSRCDRCGSRKCAMRNNSAVTIGESAQISQPVGHGSGFKSRRWLHSSRVTFPGSRLEVAGQRRSKLRPSAAGVTGKSGLISATAASSAFSSPASSRPGS